MTKRGIYLTLGILLLAGLGGYGIVIRARNKKEIDKIDDDIEKGRNETGTAVDIKKGNAFDPKYWSYISSNKIPTKFLPAKTSVEYAKKLWKAVD